MQRDSNYIYEEDQWRLLEGPFTLEHCKWHRSIQKRCRSLRRLFFRPRARIRERIVEYPLAIAALGRLPAGSRVADLGGASSLLGLYLAALGHQVQVLDLRPSPLRHPMVQVRQLDIFANDLPDDCLDGISCISVIEHVGIVRYGGAERVDGDLALCREMRRLCRPGGLVLLSAPYGRGHDPAKDGRPAGFRIYDRDRLERLLDGFSRESVRFFVMNEGVWRQTDQQTADQVATSRPCNAIFFAELRCPDQAGAGSS
ncbi:MAG: DUF268 domain-containing protein [Sedimentisphaerales bacterium]|nr:DUF268 domain-containing protein [Sedimentisphaerales bacterium]